MSGKSRNNEIIIEVMEDDISQAVPKDSSHCMIADALRRIRPDVIHVSVDLATVRWSDPVLRKRYIALTPRTVQTALLDFDNGIKPEPFRFRVRPSQVLSMRSDSQQRSKKPRLSKPNGNNAVPVIEEGQAPPVGPLPGGSGAVRTGRRREFGLRGLG